MAEEEEEKGDLGTNGRLRRWIAMKILFYYPMYALCIAALLALIAMFSGKGEGINIGGVRIHPISTDSMVSIFTIGSMVIGQLFNQISTILNFYFINDPNGLSENKSGMASKPATKH